MKKKATPQTIVSALIQTVIFIAALCCLASCSTPHAVNKPAAPYYIITCSNDTIPNR